MNLLPEMDLEILQYLNCDELLNIKLISKHYNNIVTDDLFNKRKFRGFPRSEGYCSINNLDNLIRGDIVGDSIFDGHKMIKMEKKNDWSILPKQFTIINHNVPIMYWKNLKSGSWIHIVPFREQCLVNIKYRDDVNGHSYYQDHIYYNIKTNFTYHDKNYILFYMSYHFERKPYIYEKFKQILAEDYIYVEWDEDEGDFLLDGYEDFVVH